MFDRENDYVNYPRVITVNNVRMVENNQDCFMKVFDHKLTQEKLDGMVKTFKKYTDSIKDFNISRERKGIKINNLDWTANSTQDFDWEYR